ncbi:MAG TPA: hypothetical protein VGJ84_07750 [Polyangiaceae bacterium]
MAQVYDTNSTSRSAVTGAETLAPAYNSYQILHWGFTAAPYRRNMNGG